MPDNAVFKLWWRFYVQVERGVEIASVGTTSLRLVVIRERRAPLRPLVVPGDAALSPALNPTASVLYRSSCNYHAASWGGGVTFGRALACFCEYINKLLVENQSFINTTRIRRVFCENANKKKKAE